jgi:hypothetical protein
MKSLITCLVAVVVWLSAAPDRSPGQEIVPQQFENLANDLVRKLGAPTFEEREAASRELANLGLKVSKAIEEGRKNPDPEIRYRCKLLYQKICTLELKRRVEMFAADREGRIENTLPLGANFEKICGKDENARKYFVELCKNHLPLLDYAANNPTTMGETFIELISEIEKSGKGALSPDTEFAALLLIAADERIGPLIVEANSNQLKGGDRNYQRFIGLIWTPKYEAVIGDANSGRYFRKLLFAWAKRLPEPLAMSSFLFFVRDMIKKQVMNLQSDSDALEFLMDLAVSPSERGLPYHKGEAMSMVAAASSSKNERIAYFEKKLFKDETILQPIVGFEFKDSTKISVETRACDYALAVCVKLSGQSFKDYGFDILGVQSEMFENWMYAGFTKDETRKAAFKKYEEWRKANPIKND